MSDSMRAHETVFTPGQTLHGFTVSSVTALPNMRLTGILLTHGRSGARLLHLAAPDAENLFSIAFRTPPPDDTGLPHILEHSVLCGSERYPVKDPFVELLKTSLATFLNAFTYPDRTCYPCSSMNAKDFRNLLRVYCDAVFFPRLSEDHFRQEGHHLEFGEDGTPLVKGVVYNEMRGVYSDPDSLLERHVQRLLFASNAYGRDYGGDPRIIPQLTYAQYAAFHRTYYHPSNAWIFTYGDAPLAETLAILDDEFLSRFEKPAEGKQADSAIAPLVRWTSPQQGEFTYPLDANDTTAARTDIALAWATNDSRDVLENLAMKIVDIYLLDHAASPLRKALIDSRLGEELGSSGHADYQRDTFFQIVLKGSERERAGEVETLILDTVRAECERGFDAAQVESALHAMELASREIRPQYPIRLLERVFGSWLYDAEPLEQVDISGWLDALRAKVASTPGFLESVAKKWLLDNPHRLRLALVPDTEFIAKTDAATAAQARALVAALTPAQQEEAKETAKRLEASQSEENSPAALATLPRLAKSDVSPDPLPLDCAVERPAGRDFLRVPMYAGGIGYMNLNLALSGLTEEEILWLPLLCEAVEKTGAAGHDYAKMAEREAAATGALDFSIGLTQHVDGADRAALRLTVWLKALDSDWEKALGILSERLFRAEFDDKERLRDIVLQSRVAWRNQIVSSGNAYAALYASQSLNPALRTAEMLAGCTQGRFVDAFADRLPSELNALPSRLAALRDKLLAGATPTVAMIGADGSCAAGRDWLASNAERFGGGGARQSLPPPRPSSPRIGLAAPADVAFAARTLPAPAMSDADAPALVLLGTQLSYGYLWNEVRVKGGAYGVRAGFDGARGSFNFSSFRDPNIGRTLSAFSGAAGYVAREMDLSPAGVEQAVIGAMKTLDVPLRPPSAVVTAMGRHLAGEDEAFRRRFRARLLSLTGEDVRAAAERVFASMETAPVCVLSSRERLLEENRTAGQPLAIESLWER